ncbi:M20 family metallopeptidase [Sporosarcina sp. JAI121]|uniref:M20 family metallopeptidase n=1 Tax=Sporosarcina sp. JAI121 TaxID=2723064 RepID=UPI0015C943E3|nr:M20 family metallopeptidase [Sporosarcina sp. JAI121]NYF23724.1 aminobenzoyl-glutamate utilization protein B [Sporosarcina sp. JAI121]
MQFQQALSTIIEQKKGKFIALSDNIWNVPELHFQEYKSSDYLCEALEEEGFQVERNVAGLKTAFVGSYGTGKPVVAILGEFDALAGLSQKKGLTHNDPVVEGGSGHGCGHNLLGTGSFAAAVAIKDYMALTKLEGTVRFYGCPAEESGSGKAFMTRAGLFDDVDVALSWHPGDKPGLMNFGSLANYSARFQFKGKSAHASAAPHLGRSALDAVELMNVGVNYLREHMIPDARVHYAVSDTGGVSPNVVQANAEVIYLIRAPEKEQVKDLYSRVYDIAKGAALMTGTTFEVEFEGTASNLIPNTVLADVMYENLTEVDLPLYDDVDQAFAKEIRSTLSQEDIKSAYEGLDKKTVKKLQERDIADLVPPHRDTSELILPGSTDVGDVSWVVPTMQCTTTCFAIGTPLHTWQVVSQGAMPIAHKGMLHAGKVLASTAIEVMEKPDLIKRAKAELLERLDGEQYTSLIPDSVI